MGYDPDTDPLDTDEGESSAELGSDTHVPFVDHVFDGTADTHVDLNKEAIENPAPSPRVRTRPMSAGMMARYPDVYSLFVTKLDGRQVLFVRGGA